MSETAPLAEGPSDQVREATCLPPGGPVLMYQRWEALLFLHWNYPADAIQARLPEGLYVDTFEGQAFLGVVPFVMAGVRPRFCPPLPGLSTFPELNLRTYVFDREGVPGVWFFSLDAHQRIAVALARRFFHLPYSYAKIEVTEDSSGLQRFLSARPGKSESLACRYEYTLGDPLPQPLLGSLEFFLAERYRLYASAPGRLWRGSVSHEPYRLRQACLDRGDDSLLVINGLPLTGRVPDHVMASSGVNVKVYPLQEVVFHG